MKEVSVRRTHNLSKTECLQLADTITDKLIARIGGSKKVVGDTIEFQHVSGSKGTLISSEDALEIHVKLGFLVRSLGKTIESEINELCDKHLK